MRKRILLLIRDFVQAGAQRYQYELIKALDKSKYQIDVLVPYDLGSLKHTYPNEFYYPLIKGLCNEIIFLKAVCEPYSTWKLTLQKIKRRFTFLSPIINTQIRTLDNLSDKKLSKFLDGYDKINITEYDFIFIKNALKDTSKLYTHVMLSKMQTYPNSQFQHYDLNIKYNFVIEWSAESEKFEFAEFKNGYNVIRMPLILETDEYKIITRIKKNSAFKIGIFTRISPLKPLEPFFVALHLLVNRGINVQLHIYGSGDTSIYSRTIKTLGLIENIIFEGHQENIQSTLEKERLDLAWFQANNYQLGGYAAHEVMLSGTAHVFWDFEPLIRERPQGTEPLPFFWDLEQFVNYSAKVLQSAELSDRLGQMQRDHVISHHSSIKYIKLLEDSFDSQ